jgi:glycosyltransferase involved in cell wall biosynthesis
MRLNINAYFLKYLNVGLGKYSYELIRHLNKDGKDIHLFVPDDNNYDPGKLSILKDIHIHKHSSMLKIGHEYYDARLWELSLYRMLKHEKNSIVFSPYFSCSPNLIQNEIVTVGDIIQYLLPQYISSMQHLFNLYNKHYIKYAKKIITFSEHSKKDIIKYLNVKSENIYPIPLGVSDIYKPVSNEKEIISIRQKYSLPDKYILYLGGYDFRKNVIELLNAFKKLKSYSNQKDIYLLLVGKIPRKTKEIIPDIKKAIIEAGLGKYIRELGYVPEEDLPNLYSLANLFVYPSIYEGFGLPVLEAIACGTPTIACNMTSIPEILNREDILYYPGDPNLLAQKIKNVLEDDSYKKELSLWGIERSKEFTWKKTALLTEEVLGY